MINNSVIFKRPKVVKLLLGKILMWGKTENTIGVVSETLRFVKGQELEIGTFIVLQLKLELDEGGLACVIQRLDASVILPDESLKFGRSICEFGGSF